MWAFNVTDVFQKIEVLRSNADLVLNSKEIVLAPDLPARDVAVLEFKAHPPKKGFSTDEGQARMLHDLASIELQAMELGLRTLAEFPEAPDAFKEELWKITVSESEHLEMCLTEIEALGFKWGDWPINCGLWTSVSREDSLIDRILIVHRYLEGSGLDAGDTLLRRLAGVDAVAVRKAVKIINTEEIGHVQFGSDWYVNFCQKENIDPNEDFEKRMDRLRGILPKRISPISRELRKKSGFTDNEILYLEKLRESFLDKDSIWKKTNN
ncbi:DUF455 family protein [Pseudobdellovibrio exovorus]|uniref:DUF455 domain-containing protein n=1 Tax=Pseudobdellovibrio exovorus JSS TaxID=1184267 RepID=M4VQX6_9BACT|nr:DUF455 family protein [Pseudobdellovibrio exovorus]AGH95559.1 hypothetical protein A11Q_1343 [Pseudobdellovibrio exovorus JSS]